VQRLPAGSSPDPAAVLIVGGENPTWLRWRDGEGKPAIYTRLVIGTTAAGGPAAAPLEGKYYLAGAPAGDCPGEQRQLRLRRWLRTLASPLRRRRR
jgi:hypothetical protein